MRRTPLIRHGLLVLLLAADRGASARASARRARSSGPSPTNRRVLPGVTTHHSRVGRAGRAYCCQQ